MAAATEEPMPSEPSRIFPQTKNADFQRQFSLAADQRIKNPLGSKMKFSEGVLFMMNSLTGLSLLTLPYGFAQAGLLLGALIIMGCMIISFITATFMCEALTIANALEYEAAEKQVLEHQAPEVRQALRDAIDEVARGDESNSMRKKLLDFNAVDFRPFRGQTLEVFQAENRVKNPDREFKIRERVELGAVGERVLKKGSDKVIAATIYVMILSFTYGTVSALVVTVNQSLAHTLLGAWRLIGYGELNANEVYTCCVIVVFFITLPLCFKNLQNTKAFTVVIMWCRFLAIAILLLVGIYKCIERLERESLGSILQDVPLWKPSGFVAVFGNSVFLCGIHHYLPSMISPLKEQTQAPKVIITAFSSCYLLIVSICATALVAWGEETWSKCSSRPGGHYCQIQPLYNLNFAPLSLAGGSVALFLLAYPAMAIASIPIAAITTRNTMGQWLQVKPPDPEAGVSLCSKTGCLTLAVLVPPFTVALITTDVQAVIQYVGGYAGLSVSFLCPMILLIRCRQILHLEKVNDSTKRPLKSRFANTAGYTVVTMLYLFALYMVTKRLFFSN